MFTFIVRRILALIPVFFGGTILLFGLMQLAPGDMLSNMRQDPRVKPETILRLEKKFLLDQPIPVQYGAWIFNLVQGDLGNSFIYGDQPVTAVIGRPIVNSLWIVIPELILGYLISIPLGVFTASRNTGAPSVSAGSVDCHFSTMRPTLLRWTAVSFVLLPLCCGSPLNCSQSYAKAGVARQAPVSQQQPASVRVIQRILDTGQLRSPGGRH